MTYQWDEGWKFEREPDGSVRIIVGRRHDDRMFAKIPPNEWASIVASVSKRGESHERRDAKGHGAGDADRVHREPCPAAARWCRRIPRHHRRRARQRYHTNAGGSE